MIAFDCALERKGFSFNAAFEAGPGITVLFGPSGSGKTTALRLLAGLEKPDKGRITLGGTTLLNTDRSFFLAPHKRRIGLVFQDAQLFPHMSVKANLAYGRFFTPARERRISPPQVIDILGIGHLLERFPLSLSGGEKQRVAIGRAMLSSPHLLLMDEPLASLDGDRKMEILPFIERLRDDYDIPIVYVSHAVEEVARLAQKVVKLEAGRVTAIGNPSDVLSPASLAGTMDRFDAVSILTGTVERFWPEYGVTIVQHPAGEIIVPGRLDAPGQTVRIIVRATNITLSLGRSDQLSVRTALTGRIIALERDHGPFVLATITLTGGDSLKVYATRLAADKLGLGEGDDVTALVKAVSIDERSVPGLRLIERPL
jgi:molybdate transport system ATP-binding protein